MNRKKKRKEKSQFGFSRSFVRSFVSLGIGDGKLLGIESLLGDSSS